MSYLGTQSTTVEIDSRGVISTIVFFAVLGPAMFILQPGYVQGLVEYVGLSEEQGGLVAAAEMFGIATTAVALNFFVNRFNWRLMALVFTLISPVGNALSLGASEFEYPRTIRFVTGLGSAPPR